MTKIVIGDLLDIQDGFICHQVNCKKVANAGLAKQIVEKYPSWLDYYLRTSPVLGNISVFNIDRFYIVSMYAQYGYGRKTVQTEYKAFMMCLENINIARMMLGVESVYFPHKIGCGLAGGDWRKIQGLIQTYTPYATIVKRECDE